jgi:hypothetical protein
MMIAIPEGAWDIFDRMSAPEMATTLLDLAKQVNLMSPQ